MPYITTYRDTFDHRHYVTQATSETRWFNFYEGKLRDFINSYGSDFCLVIDCSTQSDDAYILPFEEFKDLFTSDMLDDTRRWSGTIRDEVIRISKGGITKERFASDYHDSFHLLKDVPAPLPLKRDYE